MTFRATPLGRLVWKLTEISCAVTMVPSKNNRKEPTTRVRIAFRHNGQSYHVWCDDKDELNALLRAITYLPPEIKGKL